VGGTLIHAIAQGVEVVTICATRGEAGEIIERSGASSQTLPAIREAEYLEAGRIMGVSESILLDYRDSGMEGTPENNDPRAFIQQPEEQVVSDIIEVMERAPPDVVLTMDEGGGYGHPDHKFITGCALISFERLQVERHVRGWAPSKLYYFAFPRSRMKAAWERMKAEDPGSPMAQIDVNSIGVPDEAITLTLDIGEHEEQLRAAFAAHVSQQSPLDRMDADSAGQFLRSASFIRVYPQPAVAGDESSLFDGL
jgi:LmbE family N-acetylglucosaminyl deacetylase